MTYCMTTLNFYLLLKNQDERKIKLTEVDYCKNFTEKPKKKLAKIFSFTYE